MPADLTLTHAIPSGPPPGQSPYKDLRVLIADDMTVNTMVLSKVLRRLGCRPDAAGNGAEALEKMKTGHYDLVFMDCYMPEMSGFEVTRTIRDLSGKDGPVIIALTGDFMNADRQKCLDSGMNDFMSKPFSPEQIEDMLKKWTMAQTP